MNESYGNLYYGTRAAFESGSEIPPRDGFVYLTPNLDAAIWSAELETWEGHPAELVRAMRENLARLEQAGVESDDG